MQQVINPIDPNEPISFGEFAPTSYDAWKEAAVAALKGADFSKSLFKKQIEGITFEPIYRADNAVMGEETLPGEFPYRRSTKALGYQECPWEIAQNIPAKTAEDFNAKAKKDLSCGQTALNISLGCKCGTGLALRTVKEFQTAFDGINIDKIPVYISPASHGLATLGLYVKEYTSRGFDVSTMKGGVIYDPLNRLISKGKLSCSLRNAYDQMAEMTKWADSHASKDFQTIGVSTLTYGDSGADAILEIAVALSTAVQYIREMEARGLAIDQIVSRMRFSISLGPHIFMEIAKIRALRELWAKVVVACGGSKEAAKIHLHARTSAWSVSKVDPWVNILRGTTQAFSGVIGGVDSLDVLPFDSAVRPSDEFARRLARNTQLILQGECELARVVDPAGGSWFIETLTSTLMEKGWEKFQSIEAAGGMAQSMNTGAIQKMVDAVANKRYELIDQRRQSLVGANKYTNMLEKPLDPVDMPKAMCAKSSPMDLTLYPKTVEGVVKAVSNGATMIQMGEAIAGGEVQITCDPLPKRHASERFERLLDNATKYQATHNGARPQIFFANMGPLRQHKARADFSQDFMRAGGFDCVYSAGFSTAAEAAKATLDSGLKACVICSTDDTYPEYVPEFCSLVKAAKPDMTIVLAGYPKDYVETFKAAGVDMFIHIKANCYETLATLQSKLGL